VPIDSDSEAAGVESPAGGNVFASESLVEHMVAYATSKSKAKANAKKQPRAKSVGRGSTASSSADVPRGDQEHVPDDIPEGATYVAKAKDACRANRCPDSQKNPETQEPKVQVTGRSIRTAFSQRICFVAIEMSSGHAKDKGKPRAMAVPRESNDDVDSEAQENESEDDDADDEEAEDETHGEAAPKATAKATGKGKRKVCSATVAAKPKHLWWLAARFIVAVRSALFIGGLPLAVTWRPAAHTLKLARLSVMVANLARWQRASPVGWRLHQR
jgi:hypothetical protein